VTPTQALDEAERLYATATAAGRVFSDEEAARFDELTTLAGKAGTDEGSTIMQATEAPTQQPTAPTRPVGPAQRSLSAAVQADGLLTRMVQQGRSRIEVPVDVRALGSTQAPSAAPGLTVQPVSLGIINTYGTIVNRLLNALASLPITGTNAVTYTRLTYDEGSPGVGNAAKKVAELAAKPESELQTQDITQHLDTYAHWLPCSKQVLDDVTGLRATLDTLLTNGLLDKTDAQLYSDFTTGGRYTPFTPTGGEKIADGIARIAAQLSVAGAVGVKVALHPMTLLTLALTKTGGSGEYLGLPPMSLPTLVASASVAQGKLLAWADTGAVWANREGVSVVAGWKDDDFTSNRVTLLAEHRGALLTLNPRHVAFGNATA